MADRLTGKVALITGSTSGIGRASAELFAAEGASVVINDDGIRDGLGRVVADGIVTGGGDAAYHQADVGVGDQVAALIRFAVDRYGRIDVLMNNAFAGRIASVVAQEEANWDRVFACSVRAVYLGCKHAIPHMIEQGGGSIVNTSSVNGLLGGRACAPYAAAKAAIINLTRQMAVDYGAYNIRANALCPGRILTEHKIEWLAQNPAEERRQQLVYPLGRPGTMREAANAALFLASDESSFVTGHALVVDGGLTAQMQEACARHVEEQIGVEPVPPTGSQR